MAHILPWSKKHRPATPPATPKNDMPALPLNNSQTSIPSSLSKAQKKPLHQRAAGSIRKVFRGSRTSLISTIDDPQLKESSALEDGQGDITHRATTLEHQCRERELQASLEELQEEMRTKGEKLELLAQESGARHQELLSFQKTSRDTDEKLTSMVKRVSELEASDSSRLDLEDANCALHEQIEKLTHAHSHLQLTAEQANVRVGALERQLDLNMSLSFIFISSLAFYLRLVFFY